MLTNTANLLLINFKNLNNTMIKKILFVQIISLMLCSCSSFPLEEKPVSYVSDGLTLEEKDKINIAKQIERYWILPSDLGDAGTHVIRVHLFIDKNGVIEKFDISSINCSSTTHKVCEILINNLKEAVKQSSPLKNLPEDRYELWKEVDLDFRA